MSENVGNSKERPDVASSGVIDQEGSIPSPYSSVTGIRCQEENYPLEPGPQRRDIWVFVTKIEEECQECKDERDMPGRSVYQCTGCHYTFCIDSSSEGRIAEQEYGCPECQGADY